MAPTTFVATSIDCDDASASAAFYARLLGWAVTYDEGGMAAVEGDGTTIYFAEVDGYQRPGWPNDNKQFHLDLRADDPDALVGTVTEMGGTVPDFQPGDGRWIVFLDPSGHPFCISRAS